MNILLLSHVPDDPNGGASRIYHLLADGLRARGHSVTTVHADEMGLPTGRWRHRLARRVALPRYVRRRGLQESPADYDVVMASNGTAHELFRHLGRGADGPVLVNHVHGLARFDHAAALSESLFGHWHSSLANRLVTGPFQDRWDVAGVDLADVTIVQNVRDLSAVTHDMKGEEVRVIPGAIHPTLHHASCHIRQPSDRRPSDVLWFATWEARKGSYHMPAALRRMRAANPQITLTIGGTGRPSDDIVSQFDPLDRHAIRVLSKISVEQQIDLLNECSIFVFPSLSEGFGLALVEAMAFGLAAVTSNTAFGGDYMTDRVHGRTVPVDAVHLADAVVELVEDSGLRQRTAEHGRQLARSFTAQKMVDHYESVFAGMRPTSVAASR